MCGVCGIFSFNHPVNVLWVQAMNRALKHRGPDDEGYLVADTEAGIFSDCSGDDTVVSLKSRLTSVREINNIEPDLVLGHRRLSIIDLSDKGHQPMTYNGRWIVYNGEVYNYLELREELSALGYRFTTQTDTEVILASYDAWGVDCLHKFNGMWAFALWDQENRQLFCSRDRFGIKPFYFTSKNGLFLFASEIKALLAAGFIVPVANESAIYDFLVNGWVDHGRETFFKSIYRLEPGAYITVDKWGRIVRSGWWNLHKKVVVSNAVESFRSLFADAVKIRLRSDVPVGSCLSGGLDSSYIVAQMAQYIQDVNTFSAVYGKGIAGDESGYIDAVALNSGAVQHVVVPRARELENEIQKIVYHQEEPFGSTSIFAQWKVMQLAKERGVTVLLDGQGADEILGGYSQLLGLYLAYLFRKFHLISLAQEALEIYKLSKDTRVFELFFYYILPAGIQSGLKSHMLPLKKAFGNNYVSSFLKKFPSDFNDIFHVFLKMNLPQLLRFEDKNSMAFARETRLPYLDFRLVEMIHSLPVAAKIHRGITKRILREAMDGLVPDVIKNRHDKVGFETPEAEWFREELKVFIDRTITSTSFQSRAYWDVGGVKRLYRKILNGGAGSNILWRILSVELWLLAFIDEGTPSRIALARS